MLYQLLYRCIEHFFENIPKMCRSGVQVSKLCRFPALHCSSKKDQRSISSKHFLLRERKSVRTGIHINSSFIQTRNNMASSKEGNVLEVKAGSDVKATGDSNTATSTSFLTTMNEKAAEVGMIVYDNVFAVAPQRPRYPILDTATSFDMSVLLLMYIFALMKFYLFFSLYRSKQYVDGYLVRLENWVGENQFLDWLFGFEKITQILNEAPEKQREIQKDIFKVSKEQRDLSADCDELEKRLKRLAEKQAKFEAFLKKQAEAKKEKGKAD